MLRRSKPSRIEPVNRSVVDDQRTEDERLFQPVRERSEFTHSDPWKVFRIMGEFVEGFDELADIDPVAAERIIRSALGDGEVSDIDSKTRVAVQSVVLARLVADEQFDSAELDKFMSEARKIADYWTRG